MNVPARRIDAARKVEADLLGRLIRHPAGLPDVRDRVRLDDFHHDAHQRVYQSLLRLADRGLVIDLVGVCEDLRTAGDFREGGLDSVFVAELYTNAGTEAGIEAAADRIVGLSLERGLSVAGAEIVRDAEDPTGPAEEMLGRACARLDKLAQRVGGTASVGIAEAVNDLLAEIDARARGERTSGLPSGFGMLDDVLCGGWAIGGLTIVAARPSVGKTSFVLNVTRNVCEAGGAAYFVSLEQHRRELTERLTAAVGGVDGRLIRSGKVGPAEVGRIATAADAIRSWRLRVNDHPTQTAGQVAAGARRAKRDARGLDLIVVDYLDLVQPDNPKVNRNEQVGASCRRLREMARELGVPVLCCCQLNRDAAGENEVPKLHHLRNSGEIEQHADAVIFLHRAGVWTPGQPDRVDVHVAKQRNGPRASVPMEHRSEVYTFREAGFSI